MISYRSLAGRKEAFERKGQVDGAGGGSMWQGADWRVETKVKGGVFVCVCMDEEKRERERASGGEGGKMDEMDG